LLIAQAATDQEAMQRITLVQHSAILFGVLVLLCACFLIGHLQGKAIKLMNCFVLNVRLTADDNISCEWLSINDDAHVDIGHGWRFHFPLMSFFTLAVCIASKQNGTPLRPQHSIICLTPVHE
jgi:hypothetical protein